MAKLNPLFIRISVCNSTRIFALAIASLALSKVTYAEGFYIGGGLGQARGQVGVEEMNERMADLGYDAQARVEGQNRTAWEVFAGYTYSDYLSVEAGFVDLGEVRTRLSGSPIDIQDYLNSANLVHPRSASGYELALIGSYPLNEKNSVYLRGGILFADSQYQANSQTDFAKRKDTEREVFIGAGYAYEFNEHWGMRLSYENYRVEGERIGLVAVGLKYKFNHQKNVVAVDATPTPAPSVSPAAKPPVVSLLPPLEPTSKKSLDKSIELAIQFDTNSSVIKFVYTKDIADLGELMKQNPDTSVVIEGHTDDRGTSEQNKILSFNRAQAVCDFLIKEMKIPQHRLSAIGRGEDQPIASNSTPEGQAKNRRVIAKITTLETTVKTD